MEVKSYLTSKKEKDTYDLKERSEKEKISKKEVEEHWNIRAERPGVQSVMSARHTLKENEIATVKLQKEIIGFLEGYLDNKKIFELGFGIGRMTEVLVKRAKEVVGCDISPIMLEKAKNNLRGVDNVKLYLGKIKDVKVPKKSFDLVFDSIVLLHILDPKELNETINKMKELSDRVFIVEHTYEGLDFPISKYSILRKPEEYENLFKPYKLVKKKTHFCAGDTFTLMLFEKV
jgi:SAM-dependent methyltransferase